MKKLKKILFIVIILVVVLGIAAAVFVGVFFDQIVKKGIETVAPTITQTPVTVSSVHIGVFSGAASINGLVVGNPPAYKTANAISLGKAAVSIEPKSLMADKIVIHSVEIVAPEVTFEGNPLGANNLQTILNNVSGAPNTNAPATTTTTPDATKKAAKKLQVDHFLISGAKVTAHITGLEGEPFSVVIPNIEFNNLGTGPDGITAAELTQKVIQEISADSLKAVVERAKSLVGKNADALLKGATDKAMGENADKLKKGIGNLFGK